MDFLLGLLQHHFVWGLLLGLLVAFFNWKSGLAAKSNLRRDIHRLEDDLQEMQSHLNTQLKINGEGNKALEDKLETLREHNENLRVNLSSLQNKPDRAQLRQLHVVETAVALMREQVPGFAQAWEKAVQQAESEYQDTETGLKRLVSRVLPRIGAATVVESDEVKEKDAES